MPLSEEQLWASALTLYAADGVKAECLAVQRRGVDVCILLVALATVADGFAVTPAQVAAWDAAVRDWRLQVIAPLRAARDALKRPEWVRDAAASLRKDILAAELRAERHEFALLAQVPAISRSDDDADIAAALAAVLAHYGAAGAVLPCLVDAARALR
jgi:uncharacterized protein (TIGR02444 family)